MSASRPPPIPWLAPGEPFPQTSQAWGAQHPAPGLLAAGGSLDVDTLRKAYAQGIFPWYSEGQPRLWWSPDPRMVLLPAEFRLHRSLAQKLKKFRADPRCSLRIDSDFGAVIRACASRGVVGETQAGTWILPEMVQAYEALHRAGLAHSVETWVDGELVGGLYCVALGRAVFGESMYSRQTDASKIALAALVALCRVQGVTLIDCQQNTGHLASLGGREIGRDSFTQQLARSCQQAALDWQFKPVYWNQLLPAPHPSAGA